MKRILYKLFVPVFFCLLSLNADAQTIIRFAGDTTAGYSGDGGQAATAQMNQPMSLAVDAAGNVYIGEGNGAKIRKVTPAGIISTIIGNSGSPGYTGDHGPATAATISGARGIAFDAAGNLYFSDFSNSVIRMIDGSGIVTTVAGTSSGFFGDGGPATVAKFSNPQGIAFDASGNLYISDWGNHAMRMINTTGYISTVAGTGTISGYTGDGFAATSAKIHFPYDCAVDASGNLFFVDGGNNCVRRVDATTHIITTVVGDGTGLAGFVGDGAAATTAQLNAPTSVAFDAAGDLFVADRGNDRVRLVTGGMIRTIAGTGPAFETGDGGPSRSCTLDRPYDVTLDVQSNLYIADINGNTVREVFAFPRARYTAPGSVCSDSCLSITSHSLGTIDSLRWYIPGVTITNPLSDTLNTCSLPAGSYNVSLYVHNLSGSDTLTSTVVVNPVPHPHISGSPMAPLTVPNVYTSYQWYSLDGSLTLIPGATSNILTLGMGAYVVIVDSAGCPGVSDTGFIGEGVPLVNGVRSEFWLSQSYNSTLTLHATQVLDKPLAINIFDLTGGKILSDTWNAGTNSKEVSGISVASGLYIVRISNASTSAVLKWGR